jgi:hypothetical protein
MHHLLDLLIFTVQTFETYHGTFDTLVLRYRIGRSEKQNGNLQPVTLPTSGRSLKVMRS